MTSAVGGGGVTREAFTDKDEVNFDIGADGGGGLVALQAGDGLAEKLAVEFETDADDVAALLGTEEVAGPTELKVAHRDPEAGAELSVLAHRGEALTGNLEEPSVAVEQEVSVGLMFEAPDPATELVKLREAEAVGPFDDDRVAVWNIETALDNRRADEDLVAARDELGHHPFQLVGVHLAVAGADDEIGHQLAEAGRDELDRLHAIV